MLAATPKAAKALILGYHRIATLASDPWSLCVSASRFQAQLRWIRKIARVRHLDDVLASWPPDEPTILVTFDDGYADTLSTARPLLESLDVPATVFLSTGHVGSTREFWWDALENLLFRPGNLPTLSVSVHGRPHQWTFEPADVFDEITSSIYRGWRAWEAPIVPRHAAYKELWALLAPLKESERQTILDHLFAAAGVEPVARETHRLLAEPEVLQLVVADQVRIGSHSVTHTMLSSQSLAEQRHELASSKAWLEALLRRPVTTFAYPYGQKIHYTKDSVALVRESGYQCAIANFPGLLTSATDRFEIPRLQMHDYDEREFDRVLCQWLADA
jgi:peptidoglycan/xylan/chitin deacetylase (PgdA/CDA1 family)